MKRRWGRILLTLAFPSLSPLSGQGASTATDLDVRAVRALGGGAAGALCAGQRNSVRAELSVHGATPTVAVPLRLVMIVPGGDPIGVLVAEGSVRFPPGVTTASFTFLNVDVPSRLRGRGSVLEVRANLEHVVPERDLANNVRSLSIDAATDWECRR